MPLSQRHCQIAIFLISPIIAIALFCLIQKPNSPVRNHRVGLNLVSGSGNESEQQDVVDAINRLKATCDEWKHLDPGIVLRVAQQTKSGPEANVKVHVTDVTGKPVSGALVLLVESEYDILNGIEPFSSPDRSNDLPLALMATDAKGEVLFSKVRRTHPGMRERWEPTVANAFIVVLHPDYAWEGMALQPHADMQEMEMKLLEAQEFKGRILDDKGKGVEGILFIAGGYSPFEIDFSDPQLMSMWSSHFRMRAKTDQDGYFRLKTGPRLGLMYHTLEHPEWTKKVKPRTDDGMLGQDDWVRIESGNVELIVEPKKHKLQKFQLVDEKDKTPISEARLMVFGKEIAISRDDGTVELDNQSSWIDHDTRKSTMSFSISPGGDYFGVQYRGSEPSEEERLEIPLQKGVRIHGQVVDEMTKQPIPEICIQAKVSNPSSVSENMTLHAHGKTDREGRFSIVVPRSHVDFQIVSGVFGYEVSLYPQDLHEKRPEKETWKPLSITVDAADDKSLGKDIVFALKRVRPIRGLVVDHEHAPVEGATVYTTAAFHDRYWKSTATTNDQGQFEVLPPPSFNGPFKLVVEYGELAVRREVKVNDFGSYVGPPIYIELTDAQPMHTISGQVVVDGKGLYGANVCVYEFVREVKNGMFSRSLGPFCLVGCTRTDRDGRYEIKTPFPPKNMELEARLISPYYLASNQWSSKILAPKGAQTEFPDIEFRTRYGDLTVSGEIITPDGEPVEGATINAIYEDRTVQLIRSITQSGNGQIVSDADGKFVCKGMGEGKVQLQIHPGKFGPWSDSLFLSTYTVGGKNDLVIVLDKNLAKPPAVIEPTKVGSMDARKSESIPNSGREATISGQLVDSMKKPIQNVTIKVFSARPIDGMPTMNPVAHPLCDLQTQTDVDGNYSLRIPDTTCKVRLTAFGDRVDGQLSDYIECSQNQKWSPSLVGLEGMSRSMRIVVDENQAPVEGVLNIRCTGGVRGKEIDEIGLNDPVSIFVSNEKGEFGPTKISDGIPSFFFKKGLGANVLGEYNTEPFKIKPSFSLEGRIVDNNGPLANYPLQLSSYSGAYYIRIKTDAEGKYRFDELTVKDHIYDGEVYLSTDLSGGDSRGWLETRCIRRPESTGFLQMPDLKVSQARNLTINLVDADGKPVDTAFEVNVRLRQGGKGMKFQGKGTAIGKSLPSDPILLNLVFKSRYKIVSSTPLLTRTGFEMFPSYGMKLEEDSEVTFTVVPK